MYENVGPLFSEDYSTEYSVERKPYHAIVVVEIDTSYRTSGPALIADPIYSAAESSVSDSTTPSHDAVPPARVEAVV